MSPTLPLAVRIAASTALVALILASCAPAPAPAPVADTAAMADTLKRLDDDWSNTAATKDAARVAAFYAEDAFAYPPGEPVASGRAAAEKVWAAYFVDSTYTITWKSDHAEVAASGDLGFTSGTYEDSYTGPDGKVVAGKGKFLCVWRRQADGSWKAVHDMWNADAR
jgi:ketosteroid isomerase-like protein